MQNFKTIRLTDSLEREFLAHAAQEQYRPHPIRAFGKVFNELASFIATARAKTSISQMV